MSSHFDVVVLGAGPGGYVAAIRAAQLGLKTAIVEEKYWGGVCLNVGCIPSKALLRNAELAHIFNHEAKTFGISGDVTFDYGAAYQRSRKVADGRVKGVHFLMKKNKITEFEGRGTFTDADHAWRWRSATAARRRSRSTTASSRPARQTRLLPGTSLSERVVTYEEQIMTDQLPGSIIIAGAGAIGVEFAYVLANYGVDVTIVEFLDRLVPLEDEEVSAELAKRYKKLGVKVHDVDPRRRDRRQRRQGLASPSPRATSSRSSRPTRCCRRSGSRPDVEGFGLDKTGVALTDRGAIEIDDYMRTNVPSILAIGDVTAKLMLAHTAEAMGIVAAETIAGAETMAIDYAMVPRATYCQPQIASFGYTEAQAKERGHEVKVSKFPFTANGKAHGLGDPGGFVKIVADAEHGEFLGAHLIGPDVTELLPELTLAQQWDLTAAEVSRNIHAHPTLSEALKEAVHGISGHMINF